MKTAAIFVIAFSVLGALFFLALLISEGLSDPSLTLYRLIFLLLSLYNIFTWSDIYKD